MEQEPSSLEEQIRERAYYLWEQATGTKGPPDEYWEQARAEVEQNTPQGKSKPVAGHGDEGVKEPPSKQSGKEPVREPAK
ncbi:DUF2934 domain-containing protein [Paraburkholderia sp. BL21I4N1]|uniref:DUF2934 domain-containing protein n=1 Tax=Paraburkholderia sp. BL21I4N1 TaxID=1938801 RepID=UPI000CFB4E32|nr:DUF2934 domain-containing protein [Paraburkholderia sp. BL21I4N1]PQV49256.1 Protein of unknown function (DUF2934) [Paraburkholderia sp. BL21I4N1]